MSGIRLNNWELWLCDRYGFRLRNLNQATGLSLTLAANGVGAWVIDLPGDYPPELFAPDCMVEFWRSPAGIEGGTLESVSGALQCIMIGLIRRRDDYDDAEGQPYTRISGPDCQELLATRIVAEYAQTADASRNSTPADNIMKAIIRKAFVTPTDTTRTNARIACDADESLGTSINKAYAYDNVLLALQDVASAAYTASSGTRHFFNLRPVFTDTGITFQFGTSINQLAFDRRFGTGGLIFSREAGNIFNPVRTYDASGEITAVLGAGAGEGTSRLWSWAIDTTRAGQSPWGRREAFTNENTDNVNILQGAARARLDEGKPVFSFSCNIRETNSTRYGIEWGYGDRVTVAYRGGQYDGVLTSIGFTVSGGVETIESRFDADLTDRTNFSW